MAGRDLARVTTVSRSDRALAERVLGDLVVLDPAADRYVRLNATAAALWEALEEPKSLGELAQLLSERFGVADERALADARSFVERLADRGLLALEDG